MSDGMLYDPKTGATSPGKVLDLIKQLRTQVGTLKAKEKQGVRFKVRSLDELVDRMRGPANDLGLLIYPYEVIASGQTIAGPEDKPERVGTMAQATVKVRIQAIEDGSYVDIAGFGLGADNQDKAGGKAGSYAFKQALLQALLAGGSEDTDDTDTPIKGGVRRAGAKARPSVEAVTAAFETATTPEEYAAAVELVKQLMPAAQLALRETVQAAKARTTPTPAA